MSIADIILLESRNVAPTFSGTAHAMAPDGTTVNNGIHLVDTSLIDYFDKYIVTLKNRPTTLNPKTGAFSKEKRYVSIARPYMPTINGLQAGPVMHNTLRIELECHPQALNEADRLRCFAEQLLTSELMAPFWVSGSTK